MKRSELLKIKKERLNKIPYQMIHFSEFNYNILHNIMWIKRAGRADNDSYNDCIIMLDTETSKSHEDRYELRAGNEVVLPNTNYVVAWTISIRAYDRNVVTIYGNRPSELVETIINIHKELQGDKTIMYVHNLSYDWVFIRKFLFNKIGEPIHQLNTKPQFPIYIEFENGLILKDSYILAQRSLERWGADMKVEHSKDVGKWDYDLIRHQDHIFTADELEYIEKDTLCGVECLDKLRRQLNKHVYSIPYTATGIPREECRKRGNENHARDTFLSMALDYSQYMKILNVFHGGFTHGNRHMLAWVWEDVEAYDFTSSYPYVMLSEKYPMEKFTPVKTTVDEILANKDRYAFMFKLVLVRPRLKNDFTPMPCLQYSKAVRLLNPICDNGRILCAEYVEIYLTEMDLDVISRYYEWDYVEVQECEFAFKDYLPRWFTDYVFELFYDKTTLKGVDDLLYMIQKGKLNSLYGMCVQKSLRDNVIEDYTTGEYRIESMTSEEDYEKYINNKNSILPYQWGVWVTAYAFHNLFELGEMAEHWLYSDTDSCYGQGWDNYKLEHYNKKCIEKLQANGYDSITHNGKSYTLGAAEFDGAYQEYVFLGSKRYAARYTDDERTEEKNRGKLKITVAGVPKKGVKCLNDDITNFKDGVIFDGSTSGKKLHTINVVEKITKNEYGDEIGDSINLSPCSYKMTSVKDTEWASQFFYNESEVQVYDEEGIL